MASRVRCPVCGRSFKAPTSEVAQTYLCLACGARFDVPAGGQPAVNPPADPEGFSVISESVPQPRPTSATPPWIYAVAGCAVGFLIALFFFLANRSAPPVVTPVPSATAPVPATTTTRPLPAWWNTAPPTTAPVIVQAPAAPPLQPPAPLPPAPIPATVPAWRHAQPVKVQATLHDDLDERIGSGIHNGITYLLGRFTDNGKKQSVDFPEAGLAALGIYSLLHAGEATNDLRIGPHTAAIEPLLKQLKTLKMETGNATYARSLRASALGVYNRPEDLPALRIDTAWLLKSSIDGAYTYALAPADQPIDPDKWDNSNSQYGVLGVWAAAEAGIDIPQSYWAHVQHHWLNCQLPTGEWGYDPNSQVGRLSMTVAGITTLFVTQDELGGAVTSTTGHTPVTNALEKGLNWLETGDNSITLPAFFYSYNLYGLERAALASGFKYFGTHNWYRELATRSLAQQRADGSFPGDPSGVTSDDAIVASSFNLLFLSRGRHPIFMNKLRYDGSWNNTPRDISNLTHFAAHMLERPVNWQVVSLDSDWTDWMDSPILFIAGDQPPKLQKGDYDKLRLFIQNGGLLFTHADDGSTAFNTFAANLAHQLFPDYALTDLPADHEIYSTLFPIKNGPRLQGVSNGSRLLMLHSPTDIASIWQSRPWKDESAAAAYQLGLNTFIYCAGRVNFRNKLQTPLLLDPQATPVATLPVARLRYAGNWDPEPAGWARFAKLMFGNTSIKVEATTIDFTHLNAGTTPFAHLTGTTDAHFDAGQIQAIHDYVNNGGVLLIEPCGGSAAFTQAILSNLLPAAFPDVNVQTLPPDHPILTGTAPGMEAISLHLRQHSIDLTGSATAPLHYLSQGSGLVIISPVDLSTALLGTNHYTVNGYDPQTATALLGNLLIWTIDR